MFSKWKKFVGSFNSNRAVAKIAAGPRRERVTKRSIVLALFFVWLTTLAALAETVITDDNGVSGFELHDKGLYWWDGPGICGENLHEATVTLRNHLGVSTIRKLVSDCHALERTKSNATRDDTYFYFFVGGQLHRKSVWSQLSQPALSLNLAPPLPASQFSAYVLAADGMLYWGRYASDTNTSALQQMDAAGNSAPVELTSFTGEVDKIEKVRYSSNGQSVDALVILTRGGSLLRYKLGQAGGVQSLATGAADFAIQTVTSFNGSTTSVYAAIGDLQPSPQTPAGKLLRINLDTLQTTTVFTPDATQPHNQVIGVATDSDISLVLNFPHKIYLAEAPVSCGDLFCSVASARIRRHALPAADDGNWTQIVTTGVEGNLRSDDQWLYYMASPVNNVGQIYKISTDAPAQELDFKAEGLEVVQTVQSVDIDIKLVAGKPTFVRGYARLTKNTTDVSRWFPTVVLTGKLNGQTLPGGPLTPINDPGLGLVTNVNDLRNDSTKSYLFQLPDSWINKGGNLELTMTLDPNKLIGVTGDRADDVVNLKQAAQIVEKADVCIDFLRMRTEKTVSKNPAGMADIVGRARSMLPLRFYDIHRLDTILSRPAVDVRIDCWGPICVPVVHILTNEPWHFPGDKDFALATLMGWDLFTDSVGQCSALHTVGMVDPSEPDFSGIGFPVQWDSLVKMRTDDGDQPWNSTDAGVTMAHEFGHNYFRFHIDQTLSKVDCGGSKPDWPYDTYPYDQCTLGADNKYMGFDSINTTTVLPNMAADVMSYASSTWTSDFSWKAIWGWVPDAQKETEVAVQAAAMAVPHSPMLMVSGVITASQQKAHFDFFYSFPEGAAPTAKVQESLYLAAHIRPAAAEPYQLKQLDSNGAVLATDALAVITDSPHVSNLLPFAQYVPLNPQTRRVQLVQGNAILTERVASAQAPTLGLTGLVVDEVKQTLTVNWNSSDPDNTLAGGFHDVIVFALQYSPDNGQHWQSLLVNHPWLGATVDTHLLPGSNQARVRVLVTDGFHTNLVVSDPFVLQKHAPEVFFGGVNEGERLPFTKTIQLLGMALDAEDGTIPGDKLAWSIQGPSQQSGVGEQLPLNNLAPGAYSATLTATDSDGQQGTSVLHFEILPVVLPDTFTPEIDGICGDAGYAQAPLIRTRLASGQVIRTWLLHANGKLFACFADLQLGSSLASTMTVGLYVDVNNSGGNQIQSDDMGFVVDQYGVPYLLTAHGGALQLTQTPALGYKAVIDPKAQNWSAELVINESLLGGWNHASRIMLRHGVLASIVAAGVDATTSGVWPPAATTGQPATWAPAYFGPLPVQPNRAPVAAAGDDLLVNLDVQTAVQLNGAKSFDPDGDTLSYNWSQVSGPTLTLVNGNTAAPHFEAAPVTTPTELRFQLVVGDGALTSPADEVIVTLLPTLRPHTPATFTPVDFQPANGENVYLPLVVR